MVDRSKHTVFILEVFLCSEMCYMCIIDRVLARNGADGKACM